MDINTTIVDTAQQLQTLLQTPLIPSNEKTNTLTLTNAQARRLLSLARKGTEIQKAS